MRITDAMREAAPAPLYGCACEDCAERQAYYPADMLRWCRDGFYCESCIEEVFYDIVTIDNDEIYNGPSLADVLAAQPAAAVARYLGDNR